MKLALFLSQSNQAQQAFYIFDEPTTGLHFDDIKKLLSAMNEPLLGNLHADPRWDQFWQDLGRSPEQLAEIKFDLVLPEQREEPRVTM